MDNTEDTIITAERNIVREILKIKIEKVNIARERAHAFHKITMHKARIMRSKIKIAKDRLAISKSQLQKGMSSNIHLNSYNIPSVSNTHLTQPTICSV